VAAKIALNRRKKGAQLLNDQIVDICAQAPKAPHTHNPPLRTYICSITSFIYVKLTQEDRHGQKRSAKLRYL
jgi:hypothetical protein